MNGLSVEQFARNLTQLFENIQGTDPQTCLQHLQKFGQSMGTDSVNQFVDGFSSISGGQKDLLKSILLGQTVEPELGSYFAKDVISSELKQQLDGGILQAHLQGAARLLSSMSTQLGTTGLNVMADALKQSISVAMRQISVLKNLLGQIPNSGQQEKGLQSLFQNAFQTIQSVLDGRYFSPQIPLRENPLAQLGSSLGQSMFSFLPPGLKDALGSGGGLGPLSNLLTSILSQPSSLNKLEGYVNQALNLIGGAGSFDPNQIIGQLTGQTGGDWFGQLGQQFGGLVGNDLLSFIPKNLDWSNPSQSFNQLGKSMLDGFLFDKENGLGLDRNYSGSWNKSGSWIGGWGDPGARDIVNNFGIGYGKLGKTLWEGKLGGFDVGKLNEQASGAWGSAYIQGQTTFLEASARAFGDIDPEAWSAMIGVEGRLLLAGADYSAGYNTPRLNIGGHEVGINTNANLHAMVGAEGRLMAEVSLKDNPHISVGGEAFAGARARLDGSASLNIDGKDLAGVRGGIEGWAGVGAKAGVDVGYKDGKFSFDFDLGLALGLGFAIDFGFDINVGAIADTLGDIGSTLWGGLKDVGEFLGKGFGEVGDFFEDIGGGVLDVAEDVGGAIADGAEAVGNAIGDAAEAVGGAVTDAADAVGDFVSDVGDAVGDFFSGW